MGFILGTITGLVLAILVEILLWKSSITRIIGAILGIICFKYVTNAGTIIRVEEETFLWEYVEITLEVFLFIFGICGIVLAIIQVVAIFSKINLPKSIATPLKWIFTAILFVIAIACIGTGVFAPMGLACRQAIKTLWKNNEES